MRGCEVTRISRRPSGRLQVKHYVSGNDHHLSDSFVCQADTAAAAEPGAVLVGLEPNRANAVGGKLLVPLLGIAGDADRADHFALGTADLQPAAFGKD